MVYELVVNCAMVPKKQYIERPYQVELFEHAKVQNSIILLGTGSGKTFISSLLIKEFGSQINGKYSDGFKRTFFLVPTTPLVHQQAEAIESHLYFKVGKYEGCMGVDLWSPERWQEELEENEIIVMVDQIFLNLILHKILLLERVNLIIFDECHRATGNHPMREIMRKYNDVKQEVPSLPKIMGLTACAIQKKCKESHVTKILEELESCLDSRIITSKQQDIVSQYATRPDEYIVEYCIEESSVFLVYMLDRISKLKELSSFTNSEKDTFQVGGGKKLFRHFNGLCDIGKSLGEYGICLAIQFFPEILEKSLDLDNPTVTACYKLLCPELEALCHECLKRKEIFHPREHISNKVKALLNCIDKNCHSSACGIIFVHTRLMAMALCSLLNCIYSSEGTKFHYILGRNYGEDALCDNKLKDIDKKLEDFRLKKVTYIVATNVLEEGIDIKKCNVVVRFDEPPNFRSYVQSKGRARATPSTYYLLSSNYDSMLSDIDTYHKIQEVLLRLCYSRMLPSPDDIKNHFDSDNILPPYAPFGINGPVITINSAVQLLNHYCSKLPHDKFTVLSPEFELEEFDCGNSLASVSLPMNALIPNRIFGEPLPTSVLAKKSAAFNLCKELHALCELDDDNLLPVKHTPDEVLKDIIKLPEIYSNQEDGSRKKRRIYSRDCSSALFNHDVEDKAFYLVKFMPVPHCDDQLYLNSHCSHLKLGFFCSNALKHCSFPVFSKKFGNAEVSFVKKEVKFNLTDLFNDLVLKFQKFLFSTLFNFNEQVMEYDALKALRSILFVPVYGPDCDIDWSCMQRSVTFSIGSLSKRFEFKIENYVDSIIIPTYGTQKMFYVYNIREDMNPKSKFPDSEHGHFSTFESYISIKYGINICNMKQPLLECKHIPRELNFLSHSVSAPKKTAGDHFPYFIPELCQIFPLPATFWVQVMCIPSLIHRLNGVNVANELAVNIGVMPVELDENQHIDFEWSNSLVKVLSKDMNLSVALWKNRIYKSLSPLMLLQALTPLSASDHFDLERLEMLGDSFLKFIIGEYVYLKGSSKNEGVLSLQRSALVCNRTLFNFALSKGINRSIQGTKLNPRITSLCPGFRVRYDVKKMLEEYSVPAVNWHMMNKVADGTMNKEDLREAVPQQHNCYDPYEKQTLSDKCIADSVEALIGVYLLVGGHFHAKQFMHWLGYLFINEKFEPVSYALLSHIGKTDSVVNLYKKYCLEKVEAIINYSFREKSFLVQALTHASFTDNRCTDCFQRLEFLGDSILDYLITGYIYSLQSDLTPGQMTDKRSYAVKNVTLAEVAVQKGLHKFLLHMSPLLHSTIDKFVSVMENDKEDLIYESDEVAELEDIEVPKVLGDIVESIVGAIYVDSSFDLEVVWHVVKHLMEPIICSLHNEVPINCIRELMELTDAKFEITVCEKGLTRCTLFAAGLTNGKVTGIGRNKRLSKQAAAKLALRELKQKSHG